MRRWGGWLFLLLLLIFPGCGPREAGPAVDPTAAPARQLEVWFLDVGQGDSELIRTPGGRTMLVDGGPQSAGEAVLGDLRRLGVQRLDWVVGTHPHEDHIGGLIDVLSPIPAGQVLDSGFSYPSTVLRRYLQLIKEKGTLFRRAEAGSALDLEPGVRAEFLTPPQPALHDTDSDPNNNSVVFRLTYGGVRFLFTGDMEQTERQWLYQHPVAASLPAEVLKVAHHGSRNGTNPEFLSRVRPRYAVISCGQNNSYGHPHPEALSALKAANVAVYRTDQMGTIHASTDGSRISVLPERASAAAPATAPSGGPQEPFIGNRRTRVYHRPGCPDLPDPSNRVAFISEAAAKLAGFRPHARCVGQE